MAYVGTWKWAQQTNGTLRRGDRARLVAQGALAQLERLPAPWRRAAAEVTIPNPPGSSLAEQAEEHCRDLSPVGLHLHCLRTWAFGSLLAQAQRIDHDPELHWVGSMLHDLGLTEAHDRTDPTAECFAVEGGRAAHDFIRGHGGTESAALTVGEAICLHLDFTVPERFGGEAILLNRGAWLDVAGRRAGLLPQSVLEEVVGRWPRDGLGATLFEGVRRQAAARPGSRSALAQRLPGAEKILDANPLNALSPAG
jgi:hypothetical protein